MTDQECTAYRTHITQVAPKKVPTRTAKTKREHTRWYDLVLIYVTLALVSLYARADRPIPTECPASK